MTERYDVAEARLHPASEIVRLVEQLVPGGSVYHCLTHTPEQHEDLLVILVDDRTVVRFELPRDVREPSPTEVEIWSLEDYRRAIGQGRHSIFVDLAAARARELIEGTRTPER